MTTTQNFAAKASVAFVAIAMAFTLVAPAAKAQDVSGMTLEQLTALVNQLQSQLSGSAATGSCSYTFTRSLGTGSTGADVMNLQKFLNGSADTQVAAAGAAGSAGMETSFYGPATAAAVSKFQTKYSADILVPAGLTMPTGYFGPSSMAKANALCATGTGTGTGTGSTSGDLEGGAGSIQDADYVTSLNNEEVGEDTEDVEVAGLEIEADDGSDIEIRAVNLNFSQGTAASDFDKYAEEVSVWFDGEEVARVDADEFNDDDNFDKTITLDEGAIIRADESGELVVAVSGVSNLDSDDATDTWTLEFESVRFADAQGGIITDTSTGDINDATGRTFSFENFATAADLEFKVSKGDEEINDARSIAVSSTTNTDNVEILSFEVEVEGNSDVTVDDLAVDFGTSTGDLLTDLISGAELVVDGEVIGSESITSAYNDDGIVVFDSLDWTVEAGDTIEVIVRVDMQELNTGTFAAGATLSASVDPDNASWDVEDENGDDLVAGDKSGSATSDAHGFFADGIQVGFVSVDEEIVAGDSADDDYVKLTIKFDVTAFGETIYVDDTMADKIGSTTGGNAYDVERSDGTDVAAASSTFALSSTADDEGNGFEIQEGETETFTLVVTVQNAATSTFDGAYVRAVLTGIGYNTDNGSTFSTFTSASLTSNFKTDYAFIAN